MTTMTMPRARTAAQQEMDAKKGRGRKILVGLLLAVLVLGAVAWFLVKPQPSEEPVAGEVLTLEPVQVNLAAGHYLRVGVALQLVEGAYEVDGSKALDAVISVFSGRQLSQISTAQQREDLRTQLTERLDLAYDGEVMEVYFTEFVTQ